MSLIVICPTRGRPERALEAYQSFEETRSRVKDVYTRMIFVVDEDDASYDGMNTVIGDEPSRGLPWKHYPHSGGMASALNAAVKSWAPHFDVVGFVGDDHRFRTQNWDYEIEAALTDNGGGFAYGDDRARHDIPTQVFISSKIIMALGWMALPGATHMYLDNAWKELGEGADCLYYLPDVVIEHMHPFAGKAPMDEGYERVNAQSVYDHDQDVFNAWYHGQRAADIETVRGVLG